MPRIACLHTSDGNAAIFDAARDTARLTDVSLHHTVRADLLAAAEREGGLTPDIAAETVAVLQGLCAGADAVLLTCSTLGPAAQDAATGATVPVMRVDAALARAAVKAGGRVVVLCAVETTVAPTRRLFEDAARATGAAVEVQVVPHAWAAFKAGDLDRYRILVARAAVAAREAGATRVALAQVSMAGAAALLPEDRRPLTSPVVGLVAAARAG
ncbi:aspartate/glutamate racemase family protein [Methylobacterium platani]|uniref:Asp/Glu racemase n=2 Tax=Methylobacterium platani TaxID=427683 RepID=A0A179S498_9HYPH|nr:aspartate/glutamate racemase family protein [Methylobacterium platani]KMO11771.1 Asp/Glu racemase [Methylobacterium platani JCM 14648]OAS18818.1 Asp/Glu racemase [Methylobacterium platani]